MIKARQYEPIHNFILNYRNELICGNRVTGRGGSHRLTTRLSRIDGTYNLMAVDLSFYVKDAPPLVARQPVCRREIRLEHERTYNNNNTNNHDQMLKNYIHLT